jgi:hypothetical protein
LDDRHLGKGEALDRPATAIASPPGEASMLTIPDDQWQQVLPKLRKQCPRLTELDLKECQQRIDLLTAKIQNRHWVNRVTARRVVLSLLQTSGGVHAGA